MRTRTFKELNRLRTFEERFDYLKLQGVVGRSTFGFDRYMNQRFYTSKEWRDVRSYVIARDEGCDLAVPGYEIYDRIMIHHMNPMTVDDITHHNDDILDPDFLISCTHATHNAIHYGNKDLLIPQSKERVPGDTRLW